MGYSLDMITTIAIAMILANQVINARTNVGIKPVTKLSMRLIVIKEMIGMSIGTTLLRMGKSQLKA